MSLKNTSSYVPFTAARTDPTERPLQLPSLGEELSTSPTLTQIQREKIPSAAESRWCWQPTETALAGAALQKEERTQMRHTSTLKAEQNKYQGTEPDKFQHKYLHRVISFWKQDPLESRMSQEAKILFLFRCSIFYFWPKWYQSCSSEQEFFLSYFIKESIPTQKRSCKQAPILQNQSCHCKPQSRYSA